MPEEPKRLTPTKDVLRELYLKSGNQCAFPGCVHPIINKDGVFVAELCHIEAVLPGGERFNPAQTNEQRRAFENLLLLCHAHHKVTDDVELYPVERMREIKESHEIKFTNAVEVIQQIVDRTQLETLRPSNTLNRLSAELEWNLNQEQLVEANEDLLDFGKRLERISSETRQLLTIMVKRANSQDEVPIIEVANVCGLPDDYISSLLAILERYNFITETYLDDNKHPWVDLNELPNGWPIWEELRIFCEKTGVSLSEIIVELRFDIFD
jgi:hypothetical protein